MAKKDRPRRHMFREFSARKATTIGDNRLKNLRGTVMEYQDKYDLFQKEIMFMLWAYDLDFWTLNYASEKYNYSKAKLANKIVYPLMQEGYVYKYYDKMTPRNKDLQMFHAEDKYTYRVRYALTQKARLMVQRFYNSL